MGVLCQRVWECFVSVCRVLCQRMWNALSACVGVLCRRVKPSSACPETQSVCGISSLPAV